jgi:hypothetical protein
MASSNGKGGSMKTNGHDSKPDVLTLSVEDFAIQIGIGRSLAYELVRRGDVPSIALGGRRVVPKAAVARLVDDAVARVLCHEPPLYDEHNEDKEDKEFEHLANSVSITPVRKQHRASEELPKRGQGEIEVPR